jgi:hypothetical protein
MLLNISNHPKSEWGNQQLHIAEKLYGHIEDIPFPHISPELDNEGLNRLVSETVEKVLAKKPAAVHIMGEMTFVFRVVTALKQKGILCISGASKRDVIQEGILKVSTFNFIQFREY